MCRSVYKRWSGSVYGLEIADADINLSVDVTVYAGVIAGYSKGAAFYNNKVSGDIKVVSLGSVVYVGGFVGYDYSTRNIFSYIDSRVNMDVTIDSGEAYIGGLFGYLAATISNSFYQGTITASFDTCYMGGAAGYLVSNYGDIEKTLVRPTYNVTTPKTVSNSSVRVRGLVGNSSYDIGYRSYYVHVGNFIVNGSDSSYSGAAGYVINESNISKLYTKSFYISDMYWEETYFDFAGVDTENEKIPYLNIRSYKIGDSLVEYSASVEGEGVVSRPSGYFTSNGNSVVAAIPELGYELEGWYVNGSLVSTEPVYVLDSSESITLLAKFKLSDYTVSGSATNPTVIISGLGNSYHYGDSVTLEATLTDLTRLVGWYVDGNLVSESLSYTFTVTGDLDVEVRVDTKHKVSILTDRDESGSVDITEAWLFEGESIMFTAEEKEGYIFFGWLNENNELVSKSRTYTLTMPNSDVTLTAHFVTEEYSAVSVWDGKSNGSYKGSGTYEDPYLIETAQQLKALANTVNYKKLTGTNTAYNSHIDKYYKLMVDIDLNGLEWVPIGHISISQPFKGHFDGNGHTISNFKITESYDYSGLFGQVYGTLYDLKVSDFEIIASGPAGGIAGNLTSRSITGCMAVNGKIKGSTVGGIVGIAYYGAYVSNCYTDVDITNYSNSGNIGGIVGYVYENSTTYGNPRIEYCIAAGSISIVSTNANQLYVGGIVGYAGVKAQVDDVCSFCTITYDITGGSSYSIGNVVGYSYRATYTTGYYYDQTALGTQSSYSAATADALNTYIFKNFYSWDISSLDVANGVLPTLKKFNGLGGVYYHVYASATSPVSVNYHSIMVPAGLSVTLTAEIPDGYNYNGWYNGDSLLTTNTAYTFAPTADTEVYVSSSIKSYSVYLNSYTEGAELSGAGTYDHGTVVTVVAPEISGYRFDGWYNGSELVSTNRSYEFTITSYISLEAKYYQYYGAGAEVNNSLYGSASASSDLISRNETVTYTASANEGYVFFGWFFGDTLISKNEVFEYTLNGECDVYLEAYFIAEPSDKTWDGEIAESFAGGSGTETDPYIIETAEQLALLASLVNTSNNTYYNKHYKLAADIDLGGREWTPIGVYYLNSSTTSSNSAFSGTFEGDGYTVSNFKITNPGDKVYYVGLFGLVSKGNIYNLAVEDFTYDIQEFTSTVNAGGIAGAIQSGSIVKGCRAVGTISVTRSTGSNGLYISLGGIIGNQQVCGVHDCYADVDISALSASYCTVYAGGIVGDANGALIRRCVSEGSITVSTYMSQNYSYIGAIVGYLRANATLESCYALNNIKLVASSGARADAGTICGKIEGETANKCYFSDKQTITYSGYNAVKVSNGTVQSSYYITEEFFSTMGLDFTVWTYDTVSMSSGKGPELRIFRSGTVTEGELYKVYCELHVDSSSGGSVGFTEGLVPYGYYVKLVATADEGYKFVGWFVGSTLLSTNTSIMYTVNEDATLIARFTEYDSTEKLWSGDIATAFDGGDGSAENPYLIANAEQLALLSSLLLGNESESYADKYYKLTANIYLNGLEWTPIGHSDAYFAGNFDGNGYDIYDLKVASGAQAGLFGMLDGAKISNLGIIGANIEIRVQNTSISVGAIAGYARNTVISNCYAKDIVVIAENTVGLQISHAGGFVGYAANTSIENCFATVAVYGYGAVNSGFAGGLIGYASNNVDGQCSISNCYTDVDVHAKSQTGYAIAGGIVGMISDNTNEFVIQNCLVLGNCYAEKTSTTGTTFAAAKSIVYASSDKVNVTVCYAVASQNLSVNGMNSSVSSEASLVNMSSLSDKGFYTDTLGWSVDVWNFDYIDIINDVLPTLIR